MITIKNKNNSLTLDLNKRDIPQHRRQYYTYDLDNNVTGYAHKVTIDTVHILMKLTEKEIIQLLAAFDYKHLLNTKEQYQYKITSHDEQSIYIKLIPTFPCKKWSIEIQLQKGFTVKKADNGLVDPLVSAIDTLLNTKPYWISRADVSFDFLMPYKYAASFKRNGNQKKVAIDDYSYTGSTKTKGKECTVAHYERNAIEGNNYEYSNRFECRMYFTEKDGMTFSNIKDHLIIKRLQKEMFFPCLNDIPLTDDERKLILQSKEEGNENCIREALSAKEYTKLRNKVKPHRVPLEELYIESAYHQLYDFLIITDR